MRSIGDSPRILYVSSVWPGETAFGGGLRSSSVLQALQQIGSVEVLVLKDETENGEYRAEGNYAATVTSSVEVRQSPNANFLKKMRWTLNPRSDYPNGCAVDQGILQKVLHKLHEFDLVWFFQLRSPDAFPNVVWQRSVVDIDNLPSMFERARMQEESNSLNGLLTFRRLLSWKRREKLLGERFNVLAVCSDEDKDYLEGLGIKRPVHVIPNGFPRPASEPIHKPSTPPRIGFIGLFEYAPNRDGMQWFVDKCWPRIKLEVPGARLRIVGKDSDGPLKPEGPDIDGLGWLADPAEEVSSWSSMVVPLHVGAGTRIKIAFGFSQKCPIVSTQLGAYGYGAANGREMFLANTAEEFSSACIKAIREPQVASQMAERAWQEFVNKWTWDAIRPRVWAAAEDCMRQPVVRGK